MAFYPKKYLTDFNWFTVDTSHIATTYGTAVKDAVEVAMFGNCGITDYVLCRDYACTKLSNDTNIEMQSSTAAQIAADGSVAEADLHDNVIETTEARRLLEEEESAPTSRALQAQTAIPNPQITYSTYFSDSKTTIKKAATYQARVAVDASAVYSKTLYLGAIT